MSEENLKPSNFTMCPWDCIFQQSEYETIATNIMVILKRTGDKWRKLSWKEYKKERLKDGNFTGSEVGYFDKVVKYCSSWQEAISFSPKWAKVPKST